MKKTLDKLMQGYEKFREKYASGDESVMRQLAEHGQQPQTMVIACSDSRVDPALIFQCDPGELFVVRNVANIVPPYEPDDKHHGVSAALEFAVCYLEVKHLVILGHSQCGGIQALLGAETLKQNDFITNWVSLTKQQGAVEGADCCAKEALKNSYKNCLSFPWIKQQVEKGKLQIHLWFFDIKAGELQRVLS